MTRATSGGTRGRVRILPAGESALLVRLGDHISPRIHARVLALLAALDVALPPGLRDLTPAYASLLVQFDPLTTSSAAIAEAIRAALGRVGHADGARGRLVHVPVSYGGDDGPDLLEVAHLIGLPPEEVVRRHAAATYRVYFLGFLAGFPYLGGLPSELAVPRLAAPRTRVPAGSVALAERQTGIYPVASPGGWRLIGHTSLRLFDPTANPPALLHPGDRVRFVPTVSGDSASGETYAPPTTVRTGRHTEEGIPWLRVLRPGPLTTVQDLGRSGYARYGVSTSGAADTDALLLGNLLLGNPPTAAGLEITLGGCAFDILTPCAVVLTGADCDARCDDMPSRPGVVAHLLPGQTLSLGMAGAGVRAYLCVVGGVAVPPVLGSRSTDLRAGLGGLEGHALRQGDVLYALPAAQMGESAGRRRSRESAHQVSGDGVAALWVLPGPHALEAPAELEALLAGSYVVDPRSDRMGLRLRRREQAREPRLYGGQVLSEGVPRGAVQVPPGGEPIVLLADAQTTGGYPVPAVVVAADHWRAAQLRPGDAVRFMLATEEQALAALCARQIALEQAAREAGFAPGETGAPDSEALMRGFAEWSEAADLGTIGEEDDDAT